MTNVELLNNINNKKQPSKVVNQKDKSHSYQICGVNASRDLVSRRIFDVPLYVNQVVCK